MKFLFNRLLIIILFVAISVTSCIRPVENVNLPGNKPKLVIVSFISPQDTVLSVKVSNSFPLGSVVNYQDSLKDAQVILSDGSSSINLPYERDFNRYSVDAALFPIAAGKTYFLSVTTPNGLSANASCTIPTIGNTSLQAYVDSSQGQGSSSKYTTYKVRYEWNDINGQTNYYRVYGLLMVGDNFSVSPRTFIYDYDNIIYTDLNKDGGRFSTEVFEENLYKYNYSYPVKYVESYLLTTDKNYYEFYRTAQNFSDDPFSEPTNIFSNVKGGLGVFAGFQLYKIKTDLL